VNVSWPQFIRHYRAPLLLAIGRERGRMGTWYGEYDGIFTVREFVICPDDRPAVAPFDMPFRGPDHPTEPPDLAGIAPISLQEFEALWEQFAQPRLHVFAFARPLRANDESIRYFRQPFLAEFKIAEGTSDIYTEFAAGVPRRSFEVFAERALVAPYDTGIPDVDTDEMLESVQQGLDAEGEPMDPRLHPEEIRHTLFEALWEQHALPRLRAIARSSGT
jgi:hypothetical protein